MNYKTVGIHITKKNRKYFVAEINNHKIKLESDAIREN